MGAGVLAEVGEKEGKMVTVKSGRFGAYINWNRVNAKLPSEYVDDPCYATAVGLLLYNLQDLNNKKQSIQADEESMFSRIQSWFKGEF